MKVRASLVALSLVVLAACSSGGTAEKTPTPGASSGSASALPTYPAVTKPNLLVIEADDMRSDDLRFMPKTHALIGDRGAEMRNSFAPYPLCCPSRASFLTGKYAHNHKVYSHVTPWGFGAFDDRVTVATVLQQAGYRTALIGKYLNGYGFQPTPRTKQPSLSYVPPGWDTWRAGVEHRFPAGSPLRGGTYHYYSMTQNENGTITPHRGVYSTDLTGKQTRTAIEDFGEEQPSKPWFVWWTPVAPHFGGPREPDDPRPLARTDTVAEIFKTPARPKSVRGKFDKQIPRAPGVKRTGPTEADMSDKPLALRETPEMDKAEKKAVREIARQRAEALSVLDDQVGRTLTTLRRTGQLARTIVVFTSDNGYFLGEHRKRDGKILAHEPSLRVPLLIAGPGIPRGPRYDPVSTVDLAPTFAGWAGTTMPGADGLDLSTRLSQRDRGWIRPVVTEGLIGSPTYFKEGGPGFDTPLNTRGVRTGRYKLVKYATGEVELYDLLKDPAELESRHADPSYDAVQTRLDAVWQRYISCAGAACSAPLPADLQLSPAQAKQLTEDQIEKTTEYYAK